jgi:hypothetical protein
VKEYRIDVVRTRRYLVTARNRQEAVEIVTMYDANNDYGEGEIEDRFVRRKPAEENFLIRIDRRDAFPWEFKNEDTEED